VNSRVKIIHVVGCVGAGKSYCIQKTWPIFEVFDPKDIYEFDQFSPLDLQHPDQYTQFVSALEVKFEEYIHWCREIRQPIGIVESSGINQKLSLLLSLYTVLTIWVIPNLTRIYSPSLLQERPYASNLNSLILQKKADGGIIAQLQYNGNKNEFVGPIPEAFRQFFPRKKAPSEKCIVSPTSIYDTFQMKEKYYCPTCSAEFSKGEYLLLHFQRYPQCQK
jgi:hypothetical protein